MCEEGMNASEDQKNEGEIMKMGEEEMQGQDE